MSGEAFSEADLFQEALNDVDPEFLQKLPPDMQSVVFEDTPTCCSGTHGCKRALDDEPPEDFEGVSSEDEGDGSDSVSEPYVKADLIEEFFSQEKLKKQKEESKKKKKRDEYLEEFLQALDKNLATIRSLDANKQACSNCGCKRADFFCSVCSQYCCDGCDEGFCRDNHPVWSYSENFAHELCEMNKKKSILKFPGTLHECHSARNVLDIKTDCFCGDVVLPHHVRLLQEGFGICYGKALYCPECSNPFMAWWAHRFILVREDFAVSFEVCDFLLHMADSSFGSIERAIASRNKATGMALPPGTLTLTKASWQQFLVRIKADDPCFGCVNPLTGENNPDNIISDFSCLVQDVKPSGKRVDGVLTRIVADEHEFGASADIFAEACKAGGSKSKPQTAPPEKNPTKKGRRKKCPDKFAAPTDRVGKGANIKKILLHACCHKHALLAPLSRAPGERDQYIYATLDNLRRRGIVGKKNSFDDACHLILPALAALPHLPEDIKIWMVAYVANLTYGPFHGPNHGPECFLKFFCKGEVCAFFADTIESIFKGLKVNLHTLRKLNFSFFVTELDWRFMNWNDMVSKDFALTYIDYWKTNNEKINEGIAQVHLMCIRMKLEVEGKSIDEILDEVLSWDKDTLVRRRVADKELNLVHLLLQHNYASVLLSRSQGTRSHLSKKILPSPAAWEFICAESSMALKARVDSLGKQINGAMKGVSSDLKGLKDWKKESTSDFLLRRDDFKQLLQRFLLERLRILREDLFHSIREEALVSRSYYKEEMLGQNHLRSRIWPNGRMRRAAISKWTTIYQSLRNHLINKFGVGADAIVRFEAMQAQANDLEYVWDEELTESSSQRIGLFQTCFKLRSRYKMKPTILHWIDQWGANLLLRLRRVIIKVVDGCADLTDRLSAIKYFEAGMHFLNAHRSKRKKHLDFRNSFANIFRTILAGQPRMFSEKEILLAFGCNPSTDEIMEDTDIKREDHFFNGAATGSAIDQMETKPSSKRSKSNGRVILKKFRLAVGDEILRRDINIQESLFISSNDTKSISVPSNLESGSEAKPMNAETSLQLKLTGNSDASKESSDTSFANDPVAFGLEFDHRIDRRNAEEMQLSERIRLAKESHAQSLVTTLQNELESVQNSRINEVLVWGITQHPILANSPVSPEKIQVLVRHRISGPSIHRLKKIHMYGDDKQLAYMENLILNHGWGFEVKVHSANPHVNAPIFQHELPTPISCTHGFVLLHLGESRHFSVMVKRPGLANYLHYANTLGEGIIQPQDIEIMQAWYFFDNRTDKSEIPIFAHNAFPQTESECLFFSFLNGVLLLQGHDLACIEVKPSRVREWVWECFLSETILDPLMYKDMCKKKNRARKGGKGTKLHGMPI